MTRKPYKTLLACTLCSITVLATGCTTPFSSDDGQESTEAITTAPDTTTNADNSSTEQATAEQTTTDAAATTETSTTETASSDICGKYAYTNTEEIGGSEVTSEYGYIFNEDHTGLAFAQDFVMFTWDDKQIHINDQTHDYEIKGDVLTLKDDEFKQEYTKKNETDPVLNGDFSEYVGFYKPTDKSNKDYGNGGKIVDVEIHEDGSITGGHPVDGNSLIKQVKPTFILKESFGGYTCIFADKDSIEDFNQGKYLEYTLYPETSVPENLSKESNASNKAHIRLWQMGDKVYSPNFYFEGKEFPK